MDHKEALKLLSSNQVDEIQKSLHYFCSNGSISDVSTLMPLINHDQFKIRKLAVTTLSTIIKENLINHYCQIAQDVRLKLGSIMEKLDPRIVEEIGNDLYCENESRRLRAVQILGLLKKNPKTRQILANLIKDRDVKIRATAINLLGKMIGPHDQDLVLSLLTDEDTRVRANTVEALESMQNKRLVPILLRLRLDPNNRIRANVLKALYNLGYTDIESDLLDMLSLENPFMKASALWVLSQITIKAQSLEDAAGECMLNDNPMVVKNAKNALERIATPKAKGYVKYLSGIFSDN
ncbi:HEAT repeat domain-containing protein [Chitinispirillales bacterium ANBcel5]|uniref:HEAT repeat domain-containing protein n=1 Tax=Cellulosispirillum alkaliphilum TaxID=3039283 RepID=UPI002A4F81BB|nr:HEAT repeat domain-containing protein [Chitinispirillales bacterium ANBcel5]